MNDLIKSVGELMEIITCNLFDRLTYAHKSFARQASIHFTEEQIRRCLMIIEG